MRNLVCHLESIVVTYYNVIQKEGTTNTMAMISIRVSDEEKEWLKYMAEFYGMTISDMVLKYSIEQLEDDYDSQIAQIAHKRFLDDGEETIPLKDVIDEFEEKI